VESRYAELLTEQLSMDLIASAKSKNLIYKLLGMPLQRKLELTDSIDEAVLEKIMKVIYDQFDEIDKVFFPNTWDDVKKFFQLPDHLVDVEKAGYFKFLSDSDKKLVKSFVWRKISEMTKKFSSNIYYNIYLWSGSENCAISGTLVFNITEELVWCSGFTGNILATGEVLSNLLKQGHSRADHSRLNLTLTSEYPKSSTKMSFSLLVDDFYKPGGPKYVKALCTYQRYNSDTVCASVGILENESHFENNPEPGSEIVFNLRNKSLEVQKTKLDGGVVGFEDTATKHLHDPVGRIFGYYNFAFYQLLNEYDIHPKLIVGACDIKSDGSILLVLPEEIQNAYVSNNEYYGPDNISIKNNSVREFDKFRYTFDLRLEKLYIPDPSRNYFQMYHARYLDGVFGGFYLNKPYSGKICFIYKGIEEKLWSEAVNLVSIVDSTKPLDDIYTKDLNERLTQPDRSLWKYSIYYPVTNDTSK
jgi:hypothetical protein